MILPKNAIIVKRDVKESSSMIIGVEADKLDTGVIVATAPGLEHFEVKRVKFREPFTEDIKIDGVDLLYIRDWESGIFYILD